MRLLDKKFLILIVFFIFAIFIRFLYFPNDIYFGFDQARDAFIAWEILGGDLKLVGPPTTFEGLHHGVLFYYLYAPFYLIGYGDPAVVASFVRIVNATGIFLIFAFSTILFNRYVGLTSAFLYAVSFEQTQFALYFSNPTFAVPAVLMVFLGLALLIFKKKDFGLVIILAGWGLSMQFELLLVYLIVPILLILFLFRRSIPKLSAKIKFLGVAALLLTISSFIIYEIKYGFRSFNSIYQLFSEGVGQSLWNKLTLYLFEMGQVLEFNFVGSNELKTITGITLVILLLLSLRSSAKKQISFLIIWFFSAVIIYLVVGGEVYTDDDVVQYHHNVGISLSLTIFISYLLFILWKKNVYLSLIILILITAANFLLIQKNNLFGSMAEFNSQIFMLLSDEKKVLDFIYQESSGEPFAVKAVTLPFYVNTTWSYMFEWYGKKEYGYLPVWNGTNALGYPGNLKVEDAQDKAPERRFLIIEPIRGIPPHLINDYLREESYFSEIKKEVEIGKFKVQVRYKK